MGNLILNLKNMVVLFAGTMLLIACSNDRGYVVEGNVAGLEDSSAVYMYNWVDPSAPVIDTAFVKDGEFRFEGSVTYPLYVRLLIDATPSVTSMRDKKRHSVEFFLENGSINIEASSVDALPRYPSGMKGEGSVVVKGSDNQKLYDSYKRSVANLREQSRELNRQYMDEYHVPALEGVFNTVKGVEIASKLHEIKLKTRKTAMDFIDSNPKTPASALVAYYLMVDNDVELTPDQIDTVFENAAGAVVGSFVDKNSDDPLLFALSELSAQKKAIAYGVDYIDMNLHDRDGKSVRLSDFVVEGKYNFIEFWASWCGPCRGEIPHLRHIYHEFGEQINIVSVSMDESLEEWHKAMDEEGMVWTQLVDNNGFAGEVTAKYHVYGIPYSVMIDPNGKLVMGGLRGAHLDAALERIR